MLPKSFAVNDDLEMTTLDLIVKNVLNERLRAVSTGRRCPLHMNDCDGERAVLQIKIDGIDELSAGNDIWPQLDASTLAELFRGNTITITDMNTMALTGSKILSTILFDAVNPSGTVVARTVPTITLDRMEELIKAAYGNVEEFSERADVCIAGGPWKIPPDMICLKSCIVEELQGESQVTVVTDEPGTEQVQANKNSALAQRFGKFVKGFKMLLSLFRPLRYVPENISEQIEQDEDHTF